MTANLLNIPLLQLVGWFLPLLAGLYAIWATFQFDKLADKDRRALQRRVPLVFLVAMVIGGALLWLGQPKDDQGPQTTKTFQNP